MKILNGKELAGFIKERQVHQVASLRSTGITPKLLILRDSDNPVIMKYISLKKRYGQDISIDVIDICTNVYSRRSGAWQGEDERAAPVATGGGDAARSRDIWNYQANFRISRMIPRFVAPYHWYIIWFY